MMGPWVEKCHVCGSVRVTDEALERSKRPWPSAVLRDASERGRLG
jgi:hypothetical protein